MGTITGRDGWIDANGLHLHYTDWSGEGPVLLAIHGLSANGHYWDGLAARLAGRFRLIAPDLRGRGLTDKPPAGQYGMLAHVQDMAALIEHLGGGPVAVIGHSMGALIAGLLSVRHPALVSRVVIADGAVALSMSPEESRAQIQGSLARLQAVFPSMEAYLAYWRALPFVDATNEYFQNYLRADVQERPDGSVVSRVSATGVEEDLTKIEFDPDEATRFTMPALFFSAPVGILDPAKPLFPPDALRKAAAALPEGRFVSIAGANHYTMFHNAPCLDQAVPALLSFLS